MVVTSKKYYGGGLYYNRIIADIMQQYLCIPSQNGITVLHSIFSYTQQLICLVVCERKLKWTQEEILEWSDFVSNIRNLFFFFNISRQYV